MEELEKLIEAISKESGKAKEEIAVLVDQKKDELSGLVSEEGAAFIVGRELGVSLLKEGKKEMKIKNLVEGLRGVDILGRIVNISDIREWEKAGKKGRVQSVTLGDDTGVVRMPMWNQEIDAFAKLELKEGDVVTVQDGWVKLDNRGNPEFRLGKGKISKSRKKVKVPEGSEIQKFSSARRSIISGLKEGDFAEIRGCMVQLYRKDPFFDTCPECNTRVYEEDGKPRCKEHGIVKPDTQVVMSGVMDDGTGNIRVVFFRELAEQLFGESVQGMKQIASRGKDVLSIYDHFKGMGKDFIVRGRVKRNDYTQALELVANQVEEMDITREAELLLERMK